MGLFGKDRGVAAGFSTPVWPRERIESAIRRRYETHDGPHLHEEFVLYGVAEGAVAFVIVLHHVGGRPKDIDQMIFYTRFEGFGADGSTAAAINRNLHLSAVQMRDGSLDMFAGVEPHGDFSDQALTAAFDAWKRDLIMVVGMLTGETSFSAAFGFDRMPDIRRLAVNAARPGGGQGDMLAAFFNRAEPPRLCGACNGRGKIGLIARKCAECDGSGMAVLAGRR
jgi:hypothetical protein